VGPRSTAPIINATPPQPTHEPPSRIGLLDQRSPWRHQDSRHHNRLGVRDVPWRKYHHEHVGRRSTRDLESSSRGILCSCRTRVIQVLADAHIHLHLLVVIVDEDSSPNRRRQSLEDLAIVRVIDQGLHRATQGPHQHLRDSSRRMGAARRRSSPTNEGVVLGRIHISGGSSSAPHGHRCVLDVASELQGRRLECRQAVLERWSETCWVSSRQGAPARVCTETRREGGSWHQDTRMAVRERCAGSVRATRLDRRSRRGIVGFDHVHRVVARLLASHHVVGADLISVGGGRGRRGSSVAHGQGIDEWCGRGSLVDG